MKVSKVSFFFGDNLSYMRTPGSIPTRQANQRPQDSGPRVNEKIRVPEVRVISDTGEQLGVLSVREALAIAKEAGLDLVEVSPDARPPVCRILDYGKYKYQQQKKAHEAKKKQVVIEVKEVNFTPNTDTHDIETKRNHIRRWIAEKARVKVGVKFRGREMAHIDLGHKVLKELMVGLEDIAVQEAAPRMEGKRLGIMLVPKTDK